MNPNKKNEVAQNFFNLMIVTNLTLMLAIAATVYNNSLRSSPLFLFLLALGVGISSGTGLKRGGLLGMFLISVWISTKQVIGVWSPDRLYFNLLEIILAAAAFVINGHYHEKLKAHFIDDQGERQKLKLLDLEDTSVGLIKSAIGLLRLREETDRALRYRRPFSLVLILIRPVSETTWSDHKRFAVMRAVATTIKEATRNMDIPFLLSPEKIALILPDTEINGVNKVLNNLLGKLISSKVISDEGKSTPLQNDAQIRFGYGAFAGYSNKPIDIMAAAEKSLQKNIATNAGGIFQNLFIDWEVIGEATAANTIISPHSNDVVEQTDPNISIEMLSIIEQPTHQNN
jgi:hypothetical protein